MLPEQTIRPHALSQAEIREKERLEALDRLDALDAPRDEALDGIARLVANIFDVPISFVSVLDAHRQLYKASEGLSVDEVERKATICHQAIASPAATVVPDAREDPRFADCAQVTGEPHIRFYAGAPMRTSDGHSIGTVCAVDTRPRDFSDREIAILQDLAALAVEHIETRRLAETDTMTGALSRRAFHAQGSRALALADRHRYGLALITFDMDDLGRINADFGHVAGDQVLADVAAACMNCLRTSDIFARIGGGRFAILLPHSGRQEALAVAERLRKAIAGLPFEPEGVPYQVTASFGVAALDMAATTLEGLLNNAEAALSLAKATGRNQVVGRQAQARSARGARRRTLKAGLVHFGEGTEPIDCTVRTLGAEGAGLDVADAETLPETFRLSIRADGLELPCKVISRTQRHVEVEFG